ncbi:hypothetical protein GW937_01740 [Candidatus Kaiserbacteria bacterium]|nr:hypothetical protein [Candidatus Kaiserbacteria bacterium]NCT02073.1 hypothetical protein [Candidatus Parcubacteria bacterium]
MYSWEIFQAAYQAASKEAKVLVDSESIGDCVSVSITKNHLDSSHSAKLMRIVSLITMNVVTVEEAEQEMLRLAIPQGKTVLTDLLTCVGIHPQISTTITTPDISTAIPTPTKPLSQIRTMANDMNRSQQSKEAVYSTTQEAILKSTWSTSKEQQ